MEVGAVKQAFNNEIILLKNKLNQAKIQTIHKLTRKAKTLLEKKAPDSLKEKLKRKAESAVNEVLIIKKIKVRDIGKFIMTHEGKLENYLNRPKVDQEKACARLLLHKAMHDKYKFIRTSFSGVPIKDLLMSREERRKLKKEARENKKKNKGKENKKVVNAEGDWDVEDVLGGSKEPENVKISVDDKNSKDIDNDNVSEEDQVSGDEEDNSLLNEDSDNNSETNGNEEDNSKVKEDSDNDSETNGNEEDNSKLKEDSDNDSETELLNSDNEVKDQSNSEEIIADAPTRQFVKQKPDILTSSTKVIKPVIKTQSKPIKTAEKKHNKDLNKNRNLKDKILLKKFKKETQETPATEQKIVDPFFITATGENYMSVAEPRPPDEFKEIHRQGNRQLRRAVMFGHVPKTKPRKNNFRHENDSFRSNGFENNDNRFRKHENTQRDSSRSKGEDNRKFSFSRNNGKYDRNNKEEPKPEKLHPSWEAKKRQSGILPFQGKKIVFNES